MTTEFKICPFCSKAWSTRDDFLTDSDISLVGYQADFEALALWLLLFNHSVCETTLAIRADLLKDLYIGPIFRGRRTGQEDCQGYCLKRSELSPCPAECECAWVRSLLQVIRRWPKPAADSKAAMR
jgi:hypothetical protein